MILTLRSQARAQLSLSTLVEEQEARKVERKARGQPRADDELLEIAKALWAARRITRDELAHLVSHTADRINDRRLMDGDYDAELTPINQRIKEIEEAEGLGPDQYWMRGEAPAEHEALTDAWEEIVHRHFGEIVLELGFQELADLRSNNRTEWNRIVEVGRKLFHQKTELDPTETVRLLVASYEGEAVLCESVGAYYAGCVMLGAAAEARLLHACLSAPEETEEAREALPKKQRPRKLDPRSWTLEHLIAVAAQAGWIGHLEDADFIFIVSGLADRLRMTRNFLHPGRHAADRPLSVLTAHEFRDARASYNGLRLALEKSTDQAKLEGD